MKYEEDLDDLIENDLVINLNEECECGEKKRVQDLFCNRCQRHIQETFIDLIRKNFDREEIQYLDEIFDGESIEEKVLGREER